MYADYWRLFDKWLTMLGIIQDGKHGIIWAISQTYRNN